MNLLTEYSSFLAKYGMTGRIVTTMEESVPFDIPAPWLSIISAEGDSWVHVLSEYWGATLSRLPSVRNFFCSYLHKPLVYIDQQDQSYLLYPFTVDGGEISFYIGRKPSASCVSGVENRISDDFLGFYRDVHCGWTFLSSNAMGPLPADEIEQISEKLDMDEADFSSLNYDPYKFFSVFHNGMGDFLCWHQTVDKGKQPGGAIWWHEEPDVVEYVDFWPVMNAWIGIFLESADKRE